LIPAMIYGQTVKLDAVIGATVSSEAVKKALQ